jgi:hypothetical protein
MRMAVLSVSHSTGARPIVRPSANPPERIPINPFWVDGSLLDYCVRQGWMLNEREGRSTRYYVTPAGVVALKQNYGSQIRMPAGQTEPDRPRRMQRPPRRRAVRRAK